jgi:uncharacterized membrane protein
MNTNDKLQKMVKASWVIVTISFLIAVVAWLLLPDLVPTHFGMNGLPDSKPGSKMVVMFIPLITLAVNIFFEFMSKRPADKFNYPVEITPENAEQQHSLAMYFFAMMRVIVLSVMVLTNGMTISSMFIGRIDMHVVTLFMALVIISIIAPAMIYGIKASKMK